MRQPLSTRKEQQRNLALRDAITAATTDTAAGGCPAGSGSNTIVLTAATCTFTVRNGSAKGGNAYLAGADSGPAGLSSTRAI